MPTSMFAKSFKAPSGGSSRSDSVSYDYSELDRQDKLREAATALDAKKSDLLYKGDIGGMLALNQQKSGLLGELAKPANIRVKSSSAKSSSDRSGPEASMEHRRDPTRLPKPPVVPEVTKPTKKDGGDLLFGMEGAGGVSAVGDNSFKNYV